MAMRGHADLLRATGAALACALVALVAPWTVVRVLAAVPLCLFLPGYATVAATFTRGRIETAQRWLLSVALSLAILALAAFALNYLGGLHAGTWVLLLALLVLALCRLAAVRRPRPRRQASVARRPRLSPAQAVIAGAGLLAAGAAVGLAFVVLPAQNAIGHTELWIDPSTSQSVDVGVKSQEQHSTSYFLKVRTGAGKPVVRLFDLLPGEETTVRVPSPAVGAPAVAELFRQSDPEGVYRRVYVRPPKAGA
jgi:hypothetical protein